MPRFVAFLRAINVGGRTVKMESLRSLFESMGFANVETFIASGNVIFESRSKTTRALEKRIEEHLRKSLGYEVATFIRTDTELAAIARYRPFPDTALKSAAALNIAFLAEPLSESARNALLSLKTEVDDFHVNDREVYWLCRKKQSESTFSNAIFERLLKTRATFRGAKTVLKLAAKYSFFR